MPKFEVYCALMRIVYRQKLQNAKALSKALKIKQVEAKKILVGDVTHLNDKQLIKFTSDLIISRLTNGAKKEN